MPAKYRVMTDCTWSGSLSKTRASSGNTGITMCRAQKPSAVSAASSASGGGLRGSAKLTVWPERFPKLTRLTLA